MSIIGRAIRTLVSVVIKTVTGVLVSFLDAKAGEAFKAVVADISKASTGVNIWHTGSNLLKTTDGTYSITGRTLTVSDGEVSCAVTGGSGSAVLVSSGVFTSSYKLPAGTYYFDPLRDRRSARRLCGCVSTARRITTSGAAGR